MTHKDKQKNVLVTGAAGFIGSTLCERLEKQGLLVTGLDNFNRFYGPAVKERNLTSLQKSQLFRLIRGSICSRSAMSQAFEDQPHTVVHLAAMAGVRPSMQHPKLYQKVNVEGTLAVLEACRQNGVKHLIFGSSSSVYGDGSQVPFREDDPAIHPLSVYAATKRSGELLCHTYHLAYGMDITILRFFTVYGPRQRPDLAIHKFTRLMLNNKAIPFFGDGSMERDYTFIDDIIEGVLCSMKGPGGLRTFNLGSDHPVRLDHLVDAIGHVLGRKARLRRMQAPLGDVRRTWADLTLSYRELGYRPSTSLEKGLERFVEWFRGQPAS